MSDDPVNGIISKLVEEIRKPKNLASLKDKLSYMHRDAGDLQKHLKVVELEIEVWTALLKMAEGK